MIESVEKFLEKYELNKSDKTFLVGFSGGCDSLCLLDILYILSLKYGFRLVAMHLNHNWRGEESLQDEQNCKNFCEKMGIEYISETLENGHKTESFAREARYNFFLKNAKKYSNSAIFTAHTKTDNAETIIYRIIKGTGLKGLQGIPAIRILEDIPICRPLLRFSRNDIEDYCNSKGLVANVDSSNFDISYKRNFIRHKIMPLFDEINFNSEKSIINLSKMASSHLNIIEEYMNIIKKDLFEDNKVLTQKFMNLSDDVKRKIIYDEGLKQNLEYDSKKIENIFEFIKENSNSKAGSRYSLTNNLWLFVNNKHIYLLDSISQKRDCEIKINSEGDYELCDKGQIFSIEKFESTENIKFPAENENFAYVNLDEIGLDLTIRTRKDGDFIVPFGMTGSMKLKKYLNAKSVSQHEKDGLILLCKDSEVLWVCTVGLSNKLKVVNQPSHVIKLRGK